METTRDARHFLPGSARAVARFWEPLEPLREGKRLGPVLWQLPENFPRDDDLLAAALAELPRADHCFEFRHPSWFADPDASPPRGVGGAS